MPPHFEVLDEARAPPSCCAEAREDDADRRRGRQRRAPLLRRRWPTSPRYLERAEFAELMSAAAGERAWRCCIDAHPRRCRRCDAARRRAAAQRRTVELVAGDADEALDARRPARGAERGRRQDRSGASGERSPPGWPTTATAIARSPTTRGVPHRQGRAAQDAGHQGARAKRIPRHRRHRSPPRPSGCECAARRSALVELTAALLRLGPTSARRYRRGQAAARRARLRRPDRRHAAPAASRRSSAPGCCSSSTAASTTCWSTRRRTPTPSSGR